MMCSQAWKNRDLGSAAADVAKIIEGAKKHAPRGTNIVLGGQVLTMRTAFRQMALGLIFCDCAYIPSVDC